MFADANREYEGRTIGEIAETEGRDTFDVHVRHRPGRRPAHRSVPAASSATTRRRGTKRVEVWRDERTLVGGTDAGAHLDLLATFNATTAMLGKACREMKLLPFEEAISYITDAPAQLYGLKDRGRLATGYHADVVVVDPTTVAARPIEIRHDLPGGSWRLYGEADGIDHVLVNGTEIVDHGRLTGARPGRVCVRARTPGAPPSASTTDEVSRGGGPFWCRRPHRDTLGQPRPLPASTDNETEWK